jgi:hypothetical protein
VYRIFVGVTAGRKPLGRPIRRWEDNIKSNIFKGIMLEEVKWIYLA